MNIHRITFDPVLVYLGFNPTEREVIINAVKHGYEIDLPCVAEVDATLPDELLTLLPTHTSLSAIADVVLSARELLDLVEMMREFVGFDASGHAHDLTVKLDTIYNTMLATV